MPQHTVTQENCISLWEKQLEDAINQLEEKNADFDKQNAAYQDLCDWIIQLQNCLDILDETDDKRDAIVNVLDLFVSQAESVCENIACLKEGMEILYCDIIAISRCVEDLYSKVINLTVDIDSTSQKNITPENSEFLKCLTALQTQIEKVTALYQNMVDQILGVATTIYRTECLLCSLEMGLLKKLTDLIGKFGGDMNEEYCSTDDGAPPNGSGTGKTLCSETLDSPEFPLADGDFYKGIKMVLTKAEVDKEGCRGDLDNMTKEKDKLEACKKSLETAIEEATKASEGK